MQHLLLTRKLHCDVSLKSELLSYKNDRWNNNCKLRLTVCTNRIKSIFEKKKRNCRVGISPLFFFCVSVFAFEAINKLSICLFWSKIKLFKYLHTYLSMLDEKLCGEVKVYQYSDWFNQGEDSNLVLSNHFHTCQEVNIKFKVSHQKSIQF